MIQLKWKNVYEVLKLKASMLHGCLYDMMCASTTSLRLNNSDLVCTVSKKSRLKKCKY